MYSVQVGCVAVTDRWNSGEAKPAIIFRVFGEISVIPVTASGFFLSYHISDSPGSIL